MYNVCKMHPNSYCVNTPMYDLNNMYMYPYPYYLNTPMYNFDHMYYFYRMSPYSYYADTPMYIKNFSEQFTNQYRAFPDEIPYDSGFELLQAIEDDILIELKDYGPEPYVVNIDKATTQNPTYRTTLWTGDNLQVTVMSIPVGEDLGLEVHPEGDQFIRIEEGEGLVQMGDSKDNLDFEKKAFDDYAIMIPAGKWHNVINTGDTPLKLYAIYAPPEHPRDTVHKTKADAEASEENHGY